MRFQHMRNVKLMQWKKDSLFRNKMIQVIQLKDCKLGALFKPFTKSVPDGLEQKTKISDAYSVVGKAKNTKAIK